MGAGWLKVHIVPDEERNSREIWGIFGTALGNS